MVIQLLNDFVQDMVHVVEYKPAKRYGDYFLRQIVKVGLRLRCDDFVVC